MEKLYALTTFLKMDGGRMHTSHPIPLDPPLAISYGNHQKSLAYFSHLAVGTISFVLFYEKAESKGGGGAWHNSPLLNTLLNIAFMI